MRACLRDTHTRQTSNNKEMTQKHRIFFLNIRLVLVAVIACAAVCGSTLSVRADSAPRHDKTNFTVVIDAGHGGHDHGAVDNGAREKDINLGVAKHLSELIGKKLKNVKVVMTRSDDQFVSLQDRANIANSNKGDLFISIHTNSVDKNNPNRKNISGASVYALGLQKDANNLQVARRENSVIELERNFEQKYSGFDPSKDESYIIFEMAQKKTLGNSLRFADAAQKQLVKAGRSDRGVKQAGFWVLWATSMPAVLVELDFICNPKQAVYLNSEQGQKELAEALFTALEKYVSTHKHTVDNDTERDEPAPNKNLVAASFDVTEDPSVATLRTSENKENVQRNEHTSAPANARRNNSGPRRRRSTAAKITSDNRDVTTDSIRLRSESDYMPVTSEQVEPEKITESKETPNSKGKKSKKTKKEKNKNKEDKKKDDNRTNDNNTKKMQTDSKSTGNRKTIVVRRKVVTDQSTDAKNQAADNSGVPEPDSNVKTAGARPRFTDSTSSATIRTVYKIQLVASNTERSHDDDVFCGIRPDGMFVENGMYKYTVGSSENRRQIEERLLEIKTVLPEAFIIVRNE